MQNLGAPAFATVIEQLKKDQVSVSPDRGTHIQLAHEICIVGAPYGFVAKECFETLPGTGV
jgi:hypothetical protein